MFALTYDDDGELVQVDSVRTGSPGDLEVIFEDVGLETGILDDHSGTGAAFTVSIPVTDENRDEVEQWIDDTRDAAIKRSIVRVLRPDFPGYPNPGGNYEQQRESQVENLRKSVSLSGSAGGDVSVTFAASDSQEMLALGGDAKVSDIGGGGYFDAQTGDSTVTDSYYLGTSEWKEWTSCSG